MSPPGLAWFLRAVLGALARFLQAIGLAFEWHDLGVVDQPVDQRDDAGRVAEHVLPFGEWLVRGDQRALVAVAAIGQFEQQIGVFFGFLIPVLQIATAAAAALMLRASLPVATVATLVSNPLTYVPIWVAAYQTGALILG